MKDVLKKIAGMKPSPLVIAVLIVMAYSTKDPEAVAKACQLLTPMFQDLSEGLGAVTDKIDAAFDWTANAA